MSNQTICKRRLDDANARKQQAKIEHHKTPVIELHPQMKYVSKAKTKANTGSASAEHEPNQNKSYFLYKH